MELVNKVAESGIITLDLEQFFPSEEIVELDIKIFLFRELILKEKEFRTAIKEFDWTKYSGKTVALFCSTDAIIPQWAFMLIATQLNAITPNIYFGTKDEVMYRLFLKNIQNINTENYKDERVIIKGCGTKKLQSDAYIEITKKLLPVVKSLMFGEACSTVPVYKKK
ncbi:MAG: DUF2480 family protein [Chitinophagales bacterium]